MRVSNLHAHFFSSMDDCSGEKRALLNCIWNFSFPPKKDLVLSPIPNESFFCSIQIFLPFCENKNNFSRYKKEKNSNISKAVLCIRSMHTYMHKLLWCCISYSLLYVRFFIQFAHSLGFILRGEEKIHCEINYRSEWEFVFKLSRFFFLFLKSKKNRKNI